MARDNQPAKKTSESKPKSEKKRTVLTDEQRIAKLEADLAAARKKAEERANKGRTKALERRASLVKRRDDLNQQIAAIDAEFPPDEDVETTVTRGEDSSES